MEWFKRLSFTKLVMVAIVLIIVPFAVVLYITYGQVTELGKAEKKLESYLGLYQQVSEMNEASGATMATLYRLTGFRDNADVAVFDEEMGKADKTIEEINKLSETSSFDTTTDEMIKAMLAKWTDFDNAAEAMADKYTDKKYVASSRETLLAADNAFDTASGALHDDITKDLSEIEHQLRDARNSVSDAIIKGIVIDLVIIAIVLLLLNMSVFKRLKNSFREFNDACQKLSSASQNLAGNADIINQTTSQITSAINQVAGGAATQSKDASDTLGLVEQISSAIGQVAQSAQTQVSSVDEMAKGINQLVESINQVSESASVVSSVVEESSAVAGKGKSAVDETIEGMQNIKSVVLDSAYKIETLGEKSKQIGEIIEVIDDIAEQTNLLALNAAIEAARAGEHGKGFAVVADEVRKLAERSARATGEIADLIKGIQSETMDAVETMEKGTSEVENGSKLAENAGSAIDEMMSSIQQVVSQIAMVSEYADNMAAASSQVSKAVEQIASLSEATSATAEEVASSSVQVVDAVDSIATVSEQSSASAEKVSLSTQEQMVSIQEITAKAQALSSMSEELESMVMLLRM